MRKILLLFLLLCFGCNSDLESRTKQNEDNINEITRILKTMVNTTDKLEVIIGQHNTILDGHTTILDGHTKILMLHTKTLEKVK